MSYLASTYVNGILNPAVREKWTAFQFSIDSPGIAWKDGQESHIASPPPKLFWEVIDRYKKLANLDLKDRVSQQSGVLRYRRQAVGGGDVVVVFHVQFGPSDGGGYRMFLKRNEEAS